jgi:glycerate-2-kinase
MHRTAAQLRSDALQIWQAGVDAVRSDRLVRETLCVEGAWLHIGPEMAIKLADLSRIVVVGAGKAGAGMAAGVEQALGPIRPV